MKTHQSSLGFAILVVLWILTILSAIALNALSSVGVEAKIAAADRAGLAAEQLARSGQEMASYLVTRGLGTSAENFSDLPVDVVAPSFHYRIRFPEGTVELYLEGENGKIDPSAASPELLENFFTLWTGNPNDGRHIAAAMQDWRDPDSDVREGGAEAAYYSELGYLPRNAGFGIADMSLIRGLSSNDFRPRYLKTTGGAEIRESLAAFFTPAPIGRFINPNFAPELVLSAVPGLTSNHVAKIVRERRQSVFHTRDEMASQIGIALDSPAWAYLAFDRGTAPALLTIAVIDGESVRRSERQVYQTFSTFNYFTGMFDIKVTLALVEHNVFPEFSRQ